MQAHLVRCVFVVFACLGCVEAARAQSETSPVTEASPERTSATTRDAAVEPAADTAVLDEVLVTGEQPGPGLWRVTKGGKTIWILGTYGPLPKKMTWRSQELETIIADSNRVVAWTKVDTDVDVGFFAGLAALPYVFSAGNNPDDAKLKDVVPPDAYAAWQPLKAKYIGRDNDVEKLRPAFAALTLREKASDEIGLSSKPVIWPAIEKLAKKHKIKILEPEVDMHIKIDSPRAMIKKFRKSQLPDVECFTRSVTHLEGDLDAMKARANAWATGKVEALRKLAPPDPNSDCAQMLQQAMLQGNLADEIGAREMLERTKAEFERVGKEQTARWLGTIEESLNNYTSILAIAPIDVLFDAKGPLTTLRERGYSVEEP